MATANTKICDLCPASAPLETAFTAGFTTLNVQGEGPQKLKPILGKNDNHVDFCRDCFDAFIAFATGRRATLLPPVVVAPAQPAQPQPAPGSTPNHIILNEPPHVAAPVVEHEAVPVVEPAPAAHEEPHA